MKSTEAYAIEALVLQILTPRLDTKSAKEYNMSRKKFVKGIRKKPRPVCKTIACDNTSYDNSGLCEDCLKQQKATEDIIRLLAEEEDMDRLLEDDPNEIS